jgi:hypothetical protein
MRPLETLTAGSKQSDKSFLVCDQHAIAHPSAGDPCKYPLSRYGQNKSDRNNGEGKGVASINVNYTPQWKWPVE